MIRQVTPLFQAIFEPCEMPSMIYLSMNLSPLRLRSFLSDILKYHRSSYNRSFRFKRSLLIKLWFGKWHPIFKRFSTSHVGVLYQYLLYELIHHSSSCFLSKATGMGKSKYKWGNMHWNWILILITIEVITIGTQIFIENIICVNCLSELFNQVVICSRHDWKFTYVVVCMRKFLGWSNLEFRVWSRTQDILGWSNCLPGSF